MSLYRKGRRGLCLLLSLALALMPAAGLHAAAPETAEAQESPAETEKQEIPGAGEAEPQTQAAEAGTEAAAEWSEEALQPGDALSGFTLESAEHSTLLNSDIYTFTHEYSGAQLVHVSNSDENRTFCIGYRTPYIDETDTNHVFEHAILAASDKYPAKDIFFDLNNKGYLTFINAFTMPTMTVYPVCSMSEEQLLKAMDVYMSCMAAPAILEDENFFKREAVRLELNSPEEDITINGTVFAEDRGSLTDLGGVAVDQVLDALYPGEISSNYLGKAEYHYRDLTYEHTRETYDRCYHFDNSLIVLYGDLDIRRFLEFLDSEYLSKQERYGTDLSAWEDPLTEEGYEEAVLQVPAYEGDAVENAGMISYAIDLETASEKELSVWGVLASLMNSTAGPLQQLLRSEGVQYPVQVTLSTAAPKPYVTFAMYNTNEDQMPVLREMAQKSLEAVAENGLNPGLLEAVLKQQELASVMLRNSGNVGLNVAESIILDWGRTGRTDVYQQQEALLEELAADESQTLLKEAAKSAVTPRRSVLVASIPSPGLAEAYEEELAQYLAEMKASMSPEELEQMAADTAAFNEWNAEEQPNTDFAIDPKELPDPEVRDTFTVEERDGVTVYTGTADVETAGLYRVYFDLSGMSREDIEYLMIYLSLLGQLDTDRYSAEELELVMAEYLGGISANLCYPNEESGENHRPMLRVEWSGLTENFRESMDLVMNLLTGTDLEQQDMLAYLLWRDTENWDMSRQDGLDIAFDTASGMAGISADTNAFELDADGQEIYYILSDVTDRMMEDGTALEDLRERIEKSRSLAFTKSRPVFMSVTAEDESRAVADAAVSVLTALPEKPESDASYELPVTASRTGICIEDSMTHTVMTADFRDDPEFLGRYLPFVAALSDKYTIPTFRFRMGAYSAETQASLNQGFLYSYTYQDPNVEKTIEAMKALPDALEQLQITEEELDGYILNTYASATAPLGAWNEVMNRMGLELMGADTARMQEIAADIRNATLEDREAAEEAIRRVQENAGYATVGNEKAIRADADCFDEIVSYRHADTGEEVPEDKPEEEESAEEDIAA